jgi:predicted nuclease with TOPRIM domain
VKTEDFICLQTKASQIDSEISELRNDLTDVKGYAQASTDRISKLEANAAHVGALRDIVAEVAKLKNEVSSLKASLGMNRIAHVSPGPAAYLDDTPLEETNGY